jgi:hypothetical protein
MSGWSTLLIIILIIVFLISSGLITQASTKIGSSQTDPNLQYAYKITTTIAVVIWVSLALLLIGFIGGLIAYFYSGAEEASLAESYANASQSSWWDYVVSFIFLVVFIILIIIGIYAAIAAVYISKYSGYKNNPAILTAFDDCCYAAALALGTILLVIGVWIISYFYNQPTEPIIQPTTPIVTQPTTSQQVIEQAVSKQIVQRGAGAAI